MQVPSGTSGHSAVRETKQDVLNDIARIIGRDPYAVSIGSTELKAALTDIDEALRLGLDTDVSKPELAEAIARRAGLDWDEDCDSRHTPSGGGSTVTLLGLQRLREAVGKLKYRQRG
jgi:hypothetical protein